METPDIFAEALKARLQELEHGITSLHHGVISKEHEELLQEVAELRNENRSLHDRATTSHEPLTWKGTKALRHQEHQQQQDDKGQNSSSKSQGDDSLGEQCVQVAAAVNGCIEHSHISEEDVIACPPSSQRPTSTPAKKSPRQVSLQLSSVVPEAKAHPSSSSGEGSSAERDPDEASHQSRKTKRSKSENSEQQHPRFHHSEPSPGSSPRPRSWQGQEAEPSSATTALVVQPVHEIEFGPFNSERSRGAYPGNGLLMPGGRDSGGGGWMQKTPSGGGGTKLFGQSMEALPVWQYAYEHLQHQTKRWSHASNWSFGSRPEDFHFTYDSEDEEMDKQTWERFMSMITVQPLSAKRICWDLLGFVFIAWDVFFIPLKLFHPPDWQIVLVMLWITRFFWTMDLPISFLTGLLMNDGNIEMLPQRIARRYVRTWLFPDIAMVVCDWMEIFINADMDAPWRLIKLLRLYRLTRILKIPETLALIGERIWSEQVLLVANFIKIVGLVLGVAHLIACFWYGVSQIKGDGKTNWVYEHGFESEGLFERYAMSFHWSLTQFVGGMDIVVPYNIWERIFAILVVLLTFVISAAVVSSITSSMTRLQFIAGNRSAQLASLRRYLMDHRISRKLMMRIQRNAEHAMTQKQRNVPEAQVELLQLISEPLRVELHFEEHSPILSSHPFFELYTDICPAGMRKVCHHALATKVLWPGDVLFSNGETPTIPQMYFICNGSLQYQPNAGGSEIDNKSVRAGHWACEGVLWVRWVHRGMLRVLNESRVKTLNAACFQEITSHVSNNAFHPGFYAMEFAEHLSQQDKLSDLGNRDEVELIMHNAYERILAAHQARQSGHNRKSTASQHHRSSVRSINIKADMKRSLRDSHHAGEHNILADVRATIASVGAKMHEVMDKARLSRHSRKVSNHHGHSFDRSSAISINPSASDELDNGTGDAKEPDASNSISLSGVAGDESGSTESDRHADEDSGSPKAFCQRFSFSVVEAGRQCLSPPGEPATLAVSEFSD